MIVTVSLNAALDRFLTVPNFQVGHRHRASEGLALAGGKGVNVARALKRLDVPVVATGLVGGRTGTRILDELRGEGILHDFVLVEAESQTSTSVVDPSGNTYTEIYERGPEIEPYELELLLDKLHYLSRGADWMVFAGSLPRHVDDGFYAEALDDIAELGARNVLIVEDAGCFALFREERERRRFHVVAPKVEVVSPVGSADVVLAGFIAAHSAGRPLEEALRSAVATGVASMLAVGAGRFEPREAGRL